MRTAIITLVLVMWTSAHAETPDIAKLSWLAGCWKLADAELGSVEHWTPLAGGTMFGTSRTVRGGKTVEFEFMQLRTLADKGLVFIAQPSGNPPTTFPLKRLSATEVVFENLEHDFPQRVIYARTPDGQLHARIEGKIKGAQRGIDYSMTRMDCTTYFGRASP